MHEFTDLLQLLAMLCAPIATVVIGIPVGRALARQLRDRSAETPISSPDEFRALNARLERLEASLEAVAIEVERNGELQRYAARLLELRSSIALPESAPGPSGGVVTSH